jgi:type 1 glutamine amidotransferase
MDIEKNKVQEGARNDSRVTGGSAARMKRRTFLKDATLGVGGIMAGAGVLPAALGKAWSASPQAATVPHPVAHDFMRWPRMFTTDGEFYETQAAPVDIRGVCRTIAEASGTLYRLTAHTYMGYVYYDSKYPPKAPGLGSQDWFAEAREGCNRYGIKLIAYFNVNGYRADHPCYGKYDVLKEDGQPLIWYRTGHAACLNWPGWHDRMLAIIDEVVRKYDLDGVYTDWGGFVTCYCQQCRKNFQDTYGIPIPASRALAHYGVGEDYSDCLDREDFITDEAVRHYAEWKRKLTENMLKEVGETARRAKPGALAIHHLQPDPEVMAVYSGTLIEGGELNRPDWLWRSGSFANASNLYPFPLFVNLFGNDGDAREEYKLRAAQVFANGCYPNVISVPFADVRTLGGAAEIFRLVDQNKDYFDFSRTERVRFVLLPRSPANKSVSGDILVELNNPLGIDGRLGKAVAFADNADVSGGDHASTAGNEPIEDRPVRGVGLDGQPLDTYPAVRKWPSTSVTRFASPRSGAYGALTVSGIPVSSVARQYFLDQFQDYPVLCLANNAYMQDDEVQRVREFVNRGGALVATHETSLYDDHGLKRKDFALADVFGIHYAAGDRYWGAVGDYLLHFKITASHPVNQGFPLGIAIRNCELVVPVTLAGAQRIASVVQPAEINYVDTGDGHVGTLRDSLMAGRELGPAVTVNEFGKGRVVYFAGRPGSMYLHWAIPEMRAWLANAVEWASREGLPVRIGAEAQLSANLFRQPERHVLHLVNFSKPNTPVDRPVPVLRDIPLMVRLPANVTVKRVQAIVAAKALDFRQNNGEVHFVLPEMHEYEVIGLEHA